MAALTFHAPFPVDRPISRDGIAVLIGAGMASLIAERIKQVDGYGRTIAADQRNDRLDLALAGISYASIASGQLAGIPPSPDGAPEPTYPWSAETWRPEADARANLVKAAALLWAAIDFLDHAPRGSEAAVREQAA